MKENLRRKKTKIVATLGPASMSETTLGKMIKNGLNVARLNFSHGSHNEHLGRLKMARSVANNLGKRLAILQDLSGPKIRIGEVIEGGITLKAGKTVILTTEKCLGTDKKIQVSYKKLPKEIKKGQLIMIEDGKKRLEVQSIRGNNIKCKVLTGGHLTSRKGVNVPGARLSLRSLTPKDKKDIPFGTRHKVDFVAMSFVRSVADVKELRRILKKAGSRAHIIAKIETTEAIENFDEIVQEVDGVMVARGDLAVEIGPEHVPLAQKRIISTCNTLGKPVIVATQMLDSMEKSPTPTRAEVSDVANAILDGADAVMLSGESAIGKFPTKSVATLSRIAREIEPIIEARYPDNWKQAENEIVDAMSASAVSLAGQVGAKAIVCFTSSGYTAKMISRFKPRQQIIAISPISETANKLVLTGSVLSAHHKDPSSTEKALEGMKKFVLAKKFAKPGDCVVVSLGLPFGTVGGTNMVSVVTI